MRRLVCALVFAMIGAPALAQVTESTPSGSMGSLASALISDAGADGVFEVTPSEHVIAVRHTRSGLTCHMQASNTNRLIIFPEAARGEDVACESSNGRVAIKLYATRFSFRTNASEQLAGSAAAIQQHYPDARPFQATPASAGASSQTAQFLVTEAGAQQYTRVSVAMIRGWVFKLRYTAPAVSDAAAQQAALAADRIWADTLSGITPPSH